MAKNYAGMSTEELQKLAEDQKNRQAAIRELAQSGADPSIISSLGGADRQAFLKEREQKRVDDWHAANDKARADRLDSMRQIAARDHGRYSPEVFAPTLSNGARAALAYLERQENRPEDARRFDETQKTARLDSENKMKGVVNKAGLDAAVKELETKSKYGHWDEKTGEYVPGSDVRAAQTNGQTRISVQEKKNEGKVAVEDKKTERTGIVEGNKNQRSTEHNQTLENIANTQANATVEAARERQRRIDERRAQHDVFADQRAFEAFDMKARGSILNSPLLPEERKEYLEIKNVEDRKAWWESHFGRGDQNQDGAHIQADNQGVKWEIVYDANGNKIGRKRIQ